ncbi:unnamed protein product [Nezara viridula]|uniref:Serine/threonine-protein phosphatase PGAM5, mitochondrial n=1 Tax=Nezara viridula TaxID=85310 RepID=A0A9P0HN22_NEZVI|nr:unnamed protein product [Nezara viridula]
MFKFRYLPSNFIGIRSIGAVSTYHGFDKTSILNPRSFTENIYKLEHQNKMIIQPKWDFNWDKRGLVKQMGLKSNEDEENEIDILPKSSRHIILIRHGHYNKGGESDKEMVLTKLGIDQAMMTGKRLKELEIPYNEIVHSTMTRAVETAKIISSHIPDVPVKDCMLLEEGSPIPPEPPMTNWKSPYKFHQDGARIEAAFRKYFHRAEPHQQNDTYTIVVCHANVIRYFVCRALQYPAEGWLRLTLRHASMTWLTIEGSGKVVLITYGDTGYMPPYALTTV